jgi:hypothetical protein
MKKRFITVFIAVIYGMGVLTGSLGTTYIVIPAQSYFRESWNEYLKEIDKVPIGVTSEDCKTLTKNWEEAQLKFLLNNPIKSKSPNTTIICN